MWYDTDLRLSSLSSAACGSLVNTINSCSDIGSSARSERPSAKGEDTYRFAYDHYELLYEDAAKAAGEPLLPNARTLCVDARVVAGLRQATRQLALTFQGQMA